MYCTVCGGLQSLTRPLEARPRSIYVSGSSSYNLLVAFTLEDKYEAPTHQQTTENVVLHSHDKNKLGRATGQQHRDIIVIVVQPSTPFAPRDFENSVKRLLFFSLPVSRNP